MERQTWSGPELLPWPALSFLEAAEDAFAKPIKSGWLVFMYDSSMSIIRRTWSCACFSDSRISVPTRVSHSSRSLWIKHCYSIIKEIIIIIIIKEGNTSSMVWLKTRSLLWFSPFDRMSIIQNKFSNQTWEKNTWWWITQRPVFTMDTRKRVATEEAKTNVKGLTWNK